MYLYSYTDRVLLIPKQLNISSNYSRLYKSLMEYKLCIDQRRSIMCAITGFSILGLLGWGAYTAGKSAWKNRSTIARYASNFYNLPETTYQAVKVRVDRT